LDFKNLITQSASKQHYYLLLTLACVWHQCHL
jgi:hypothetical protein